VEVVGVRYVAPKSLLDALALDSAGTIWQNLRPLTARIRKHPQVRDVTISRKLPGTLVLHVVEDLPVALLGTASGMEPLDRDGRALPIDPTQTSLDLPIVARRDSSVLRMLDAVREAQPALFARVSEIRWDERGGLRVILSGLTVRASADCSADRFAEILPVESDLARRGRRATELDLRFRDQIVARIE
jgi:cell division protein FtsQ